MRNLKWTVIAAALLLCSAPAAAEMYVSLGVGVVQGDIGTTEDDHTYADLTIGKQFENGFFIEGALAHLGDFRQMTQTSTTAGNQRTTVIEELEQDASAFALNLGYSIPLSQRLQLRPLVGAHVYRLDTTDVTSTTVVDITDPNNPTVTSFDRTDNSREDTETGALYGLVLNFQQYSSRSLALGVTRYDDIDRTAVYIRMIGWF